MSTLLFSAVITGLLGQEAPAPAQAPNVVAREWTVTVSVERIEGSQRVVTFRRDGSLQDVYVDPQVSVFDDLMVGDVVTMRYVESEIAHVRPGAQPSEARDTTEEARKADGTQVIAQTKAVVTHRENRTRDVAGHVPHGLWPASRAPRERQTAPRGGAPG